ncbi:MAG TPA: heterodisulfide reductase-related iron-sulfur binding cluster [Kineosporiaceae bacterium]
MPDHRSRADLLGDCVHCGFCLTGCPTYVLWGEEMDSPRGRIHLIRGLDEGDVLDAGVAQHVDTCLGCMACLTSCPSGVRYDVLIEGTRERVEREVRRRPQDRAVRALVFALFPRPRRLRAAAALLRLTQRTGADRAVTRSAWLRGRFPRLVTMVALAPPLPPASRSRPPADARAQGVARARAALLTGCVQGVMFPRVNQATQRVLAAEGCDVVVPPGQGCCGALSLHAGRREEARRYARALIDRVEPALRPGDAVVTNAAGCGSTLKEYGDLLADDPAYAQRAAAFATRVRDAAELLADLGPRAVRHPIEVTVAYHDACHLGHAQRVRAQPRSLLAQIPGLRVREIAEGDLCCGSAGVWNVLNPEPAAQLGARKAANVRATGAQLLVTGNPGCLMQIRQSLATTGDHSPMPVMHTIELLDVSLRGADPRLGP